MNINIKSNLFKMKFWILTLLVMFLSITSCSDFEEINTNPNTLNVDQVSAKYFVTELQIQLYAPNRYPYWRAQLIHADRFAGHFTFGFRGSWWYDNLGYNYSSGYTDAAYDYMANYLGKLSGFLNFVSAGGDLENSQYEAIGLIMKSLYYQMYTDTFGMVPFTEAFDTENLTPAYDTQAVIYQGVIADLDKAMALIGSETTTGDGVEFLSDNDLFYNGDMQKWKKLANTLKLRMGLRALGAAGDNFAAAAITEAVGAPVITTADENALLPKDTDISQWANACYGDVWYNFGLGSNWNVGKTLIDNLRDNNDPRLSLYAKPITGGTVTFKQLTTEPGRSMFSEHMTFFQSLFDDADVSYTAVPGTETTSDGVVIETLTMTIDPGEWYVGQPSRLSSYTYNQTFPELFCEPADIVINPKNQGKDMFPEIAMTAAEGNFLLAQAKLLGYGSGNAQNYYQEGLRQAMMMWGANGSDIDNFIANEDMAKLNGSMDQNMEKVATQRWIADYTDGFEAWAVVRDTGYPSELADGVTNFNLYSAGSDLNGAYPQRMRYGSGAYNTNGDNTTAANEIQGDDFQGTKLWWAKQ